MSFADKYVMRYQALPPFLDDKPEEGVEIIVIIPCIDDAFIFRTLKSLDEADTVDAKIEVIVHVNSGKQSALELVERNRMIWDQLKQKSYHNFKLLPILTEGTVRKKAGVGFARKTAMDEAVRRFASIGKPEGLIVSLDADSLVHKSYFREIVKAMQNAKAQCFTFQFRHHYDASVYPGNVINACKQYEIYLRYYRLALKTFDFPFAIHTIGSCFAIRAEAYTKLGGMPPRQGGEDFYFLQKAVKMHPVCEVRNPIVFPSPRVSDRVPFGTGPSVRNIIGKGQYKVYNFGLFAMLKDFYDLFPAMERAGDVGANPCGCPSKTGGTGISYHDVETWRATSVVEACKQIPPVILHYIGVEAFETILTECRNYSSSTAAFVKRMFDHFDAFFIVKFLNSFNQSDDYPPIDVMEAGKLILHHYGIQEITDIYEQILKLDLSI